MDLNFLTNADVALLRRLIGMMRSGQMDHLLAAGPGAPFDDGFFTDETHVVFTEDAVPARDAYTPGTAECPVYRVIDGVLEEAPRDPLTIYNLSRNQILAGQFIKVVRDKYSEAWLTDGELAESTSEAGTGTGTAVGGGGGSLTVSNLTDPPNVVPDVTSLVFGDGGTSQETTYSVVETSPGTARVNVNRVNLLHDGLLSSAQQWWPSGYPGYTRFNTDLMISAPTLTHEDILSLWLGDTEISAPGSTSLKPALTGSVNGGLLSYLTVQSNNSGITFTAGVTLGRNGIWLHGYSISAAAPPEIHIETGDGTYTRGATGTDAAGSEFVEGLCVSIGSGSFATEAYADAAAATAESNANAYTDSEIAGLSSVYQPLDADLTALAALTGTDTIYYRSGASTWTAVTVGSGLDFTGGTLTATGTIGADLTAIEALTGTGFAERTGSDTWTVRTLVVGDLPELHGFTNATPGDADRFPFYKDATGNRDCAASELADYILGKLTAGGLPALNGFTNATLADDDRVPFYDDGAAANRDCSALEMKTYCNPLIILRDEKTQNTDGGTFTSGAWRTRDLNTEAVDTDNNCSLSSNQFTLTAGTYEIRAKAPAALVNRHQIRLQNVTDGSTILTGCQAISGATDNTQTDSVLEGRFTIAASKALEIQHQCQTTYGTGGFGLAGNFTTEVYTVVVLRRVA